MGCASSGPVSRQYELELTPAALERAVAGMAPQPQTATTTESLLMTRGRGEFVMRDIIGKGGKSVGVQVAYHQQTRAFYALKFISEERAAREGWEVQPLDELEAMRAATAARCPFVTPLHGWFEEPAPRNAGTTLALVMGYMPGGELFSRMCGRRMGADEAAFYAAEVVCALEALHALGFIYRDLKPENILLDAEGHLALCDMGFATRVPTAYKRLGTPQYQAPEILSAAVATHGYTAAVDWWALGCLLYEMLTGHAAFGSAHAPPAEVQARVLSAKGPSMPAALPKPARALIAALLTRDPGARLRDAAGIKAHPFFAKVDWAAVVAKRYIAPWVPEPMRFPGDVTNFDIYLRMEGETVVARGAAARFLHEKPVPKFNSVESLSQRTQSLLRRGASLASGLRSRKSSVQETASKSRNASIEKYSIGKSSGGKTSVGRSFGKSSLGRTSIGRGEVSRSTLLATSSAPALSSSSDSVVVEPDQHPLSAVGSGLTTIEDDEAVTKLSRSSL